MSNNLTTEELNALVTAMHKAAGSFSVRTGCDIGDATFSALESLAKDLRNYNAAKAGDVTLEKFAVTNAFRRMYRDWNHFRAPVRIPLGSRADGTDKVSSVDIEEIINLAAPDSSNSNDNDAINDAIDALDERERNVIQLRIYQAKSLKETGAAIGLSRQGVANVEKVAFAKLKRLLTARALS